jgi:hypothetical protein
MKKENGYGQYYHQMNWTDDELEIVLNLVVLYLYSRPEHKLNNEYEIKVANIIDRIERELGVE